MKILELIKKNKYVEEIIIGDDGGECFLKLFSKTKPVFIVFSWGGGWDHVSASYTNRCLTWEEMCIVKNIFFNLDETAIQYHPAEKNYVNNNPYTLHLWKPQNEKIPLPPKEMV